MKLSWFVQVAPGLEETLSGELREMGLIPSPSAGGADLRGGLEVGWRVALRSRVASGILVRVGVVRGADPARLGRAVRGLPWRKFLHPTQDVEVRASKGAGKLRRSQLEGAIRRGIAESLRGPRLPGRRPPRSTATVLARPHEGGVEISVDACGELLHRRGWRKATAKAPMRENLAAAVLRLAAWTPEQPLVDPMCGSGTFPIEAGTIAMGFDPGDRRRFAFEDWPAHEPARWQAMKKKRRKGASSRAPIVGLDRDPGAVRAARANLKRSGAGGRVRIAQGELSELEPTAEAGLLVANPPWGLRVAGEAAGGVWALLGKVARERFGGWTVALVGPSSDHLRATGLPLREVARFPSGGQRLSVWIGGVP